MSSRPPSRASNVGRDRLSPRSPSSEQKSPISARSPVSATRLPIRSRTPDNLSIPSYTEQPPLSVSTTNLLLAARQLLQINAPHPQRLRAAHELLALSEDESSPEVLQTVYQLLSSIPDSVSHESKAPESVRVSTLPPNRLALHQHRNLPYFSLKPAQPELLSKAELPERIMPPSSNQTLPSSIPQVDTRSKTVAFKKAQARLTRAGAVVGSRMASLHHPTAEVPRFISKPMSSNLKLDSTLASGGYIYTFIWTDPNTGEEVNVSASQVVNLQILVQTTTANSSGSSSSFQFSIPTAPTSDPSVLLNGSPSTPTVSLSGWTVTTSTPGSNPYLVKVTNSGGSVLAGGTLLIVYVNSATINATPGVSIINITESSGPTMTNPLAVSIIKAPTYLILKDMYFTTTNNSSGTPVTAVSPGTLVYVNWIMYNPAATPANVTLYWNDSFSGLSQAAQSLPVGTNGPGLTISPGITVNSDTTFTLVAQLAIPSTPLGKSYQIQQTLKVIQVGLIAPKVTIGQAASSSLNIFPTNWSGSNLGSTAVINMGDTNHSIVSTFGVGLSINDENAITLNSNNLNLNASTTTSGNAAITGNLTVTGASTLGSATITGSASIGGTLNGYSLPSSLNSTALGLAYDYAVGYIPAATGLNSSSFNVSTGLTITQKTGNFNFYTAGSANSGLIYTAYSKFGGAGYFIADVCLTCTAAANNTNTGLVITSNGIQFEGQSSSKTTYAFPQISSTAGNVTIKGQVGFTYTAQGAVGTTGNIFVLNYGGITAIISGYCSIRQLF